MSNQWGLGDLLGLVAAITVCWWLLIYLLQR
jgi:hypothetical protein